MKWLDPKIYPIPENKDELFIAYVYDEEEQKKYVVIAKRQYEDLYKNKICIMNESCHFDYWFSDLDKGELLAWMPMPKPPYEDKFSCPEKQDNS